LINNINEVNPTYSILKKKLKSFNFKIEEESIRNGESLFNYYNCKSCSGLLVNPRECKICEFLFCFKCVFSKNKSICPNCKANPCEVKKISLVTKNTLNNFFQFICPFDCNAIIKYQELKLHILNECKKSLKIYSCDLCNEKFENSKNLEDNRIITHNDICPNLNIDCCYCKKSFRKDSLKEHVAECEEKFKECEKCQIQYKESSQDFNHSEKLCDLISGIISIIHE